MIEKKIIKSEKTRTLDDYLTLKTQVQQKVTMLNAYPIALYAPIITNRTPIIKIDGALKTDVRYTNELTTEQGHLKTAIYANNTLTFTLSDLMPLEELPIRMKGRKVAKIRIKFNEAIKADLPAFKLVIVEPFGFQHKSVYMDVNSFFKPNQYNRDIVDIELNRDLSDCYVFLFGTFANTVDASAYHIVSTLFFETTK